MQPIVRKIFSTLITSNEKEISYGRMSWQTRETHFEMGPLASSIGEIGGGVLRSRSANREFTEASVSDANQIAAITFTRGIKHKMQNRRTDLPLRAAMKPTKTT